MMQDDLSMENIHKIFGGTYRMLRNTKTVYK